MYHVMIPDNHSTCGPKESCIGWGSTATGRGIFGGHTQGYPGLPAVKIAWWVTQFLLRVDALPDAQQCQSTEGNYYVLTYLLVSILLSSSWLIMMHYYYVAHECEVMRWACLSSHDNISKTRCPNFANFSTLGNWWRGTVVERRSLANFPCPALDLQLMWVNRPLRVSQLGQLSLSSFLGR